MQNAILIILTMFTLSACGDKSNIDTKERMGSNYQEPTEGARGAQADSQDFLPILSSYVQRLASPRFLNSGQIPMRLFIYERNEEIGGIDFDKSTEINVLFDIKKLNTDKIKYLGYDVTVETTCLQEARIEGDICEKSKLEVQVKRAESIPYKDTKYLELENPRIFKIESKDGTLISEYVIRCWNLYRKHSKRYGYKYCAPAQEAEQNFSKYRWDILSPNFPSTYPGRNGSEVEILDLYLPNQIEGKDITYNDATFLNFITSENEDLKDKWYVFPKMEIEGESPDKNFIFIWDEWIEESSNE